MRGRGSSKSASGGSDVELLKRWRDGDASAGAALFRRHFASVYLFFQTKVPDHADDLVQYTFLGCVEARDRSEVRHFKSYLLGVARNQLLRFLEKRDIVRRNSPRNVEPAPPTPLSGVCARREGQRRLLIALRRIDLDLQIAIELFYWERLPLIDVGEVLGIPTGTVKSRLHRAKRSLHDELRKMGVADLPNTITLSGFDSWAAATRGKLGSTAPT